jgi:hypothetical protein
MKGRFHELEQCLVEHVHKRCNACFPIMQEVTSIKALELSCQMHILLKVQSQYWIVHSDDEMVQTDFGAVYNSYSSICWEIC